MRRREFIAYIDATAAVPLAALTQAEGGMTVLVVRISLGTSDADKAAVVVPKLMESKAALEAGYPRDARQPWLLRWDRWQEQRNIGR
jgi:hypothetical protein